MVESFRSSILPLIAFIFTFLCLAYSACHESKAEQKDLAASTGLMEELSRFEIQLAELKAIHINHVKKYSDEMGCMKDSKALDIINKHNLLLDRHADRLQYHKMKILHSDTSNVERNNAQMNELKTDFQSLENDAAVIRTGFDNFSPAHVTK